ncbi:uncharacterized protein LOC143026931 [Oratosquilla oratoria]|uniref:uncharacterized protein LOC143026931 n=1 Tax=Oratosquilla oratoria TaxID=337810 RepID=UPI003F763E79
MFRLAVVAVLVAVVAAQRQLIQPNLSACINRVRHTSRVRNGHHYFFSWAHEPTKNHERDWLDGRNICRKHCQDLVSFETPDEANFVYNEMQSANVPYIWTSGRKCNFEGCDRPDLLPSIVNGWFWSGSDVRIASTNSSTGWRGDWSQTGGASVPQPDNREFQSGNDEACIAVLNNFYSDGLRWHDVACNHIKPWVCEDSDSLLGFMRNKHPEAQIP